MHKLLIITLVSVSVAFIQDAKKTTLSSQIIKCMKSSSDSATGMCYMKLKSIDNKLDLENYFSIAWEGLDQFAVNQEDKAHAKKYKGNSQYVNAIKNSLLCKK